VLTPDIRGHGPTSLQENAVVKAVRKLLRAMLVKVKNSLANVNAAILAQIDLSCALLLSLTRSHSVLALLPNTSGLKLLHSGSLFTTGCLP